MRLCSGAGPQCLVAFLVLLAVLPRVPADQDNPMERHYYVAAVQIDWNYFGNGSQGADSTYKKVVFREYEKDFKQPKTHPTWLGLLGPTLRGQVGETIVVTFRNMADREYSLHPHGIAYGKQSEGAQYFDNTSLKEKEDDVVCPGGEHTYYWEVTADVAPQKDDPPCLTYTYVSHLDVVQDYNSGLIGTLLLCKPGSLNELGEQAHFPQEYVFLFGVFDEKVSWFTPTGYSSSDHVMHTINGYAMGTLPDVNICAHCSVSLHLVDMSSEQEVFSVHMNGQVLQHLRHKASTVGLISGSATTASIRAVHPGRWLLSSQTNKHMEAGMHGFVAVTTCEGFEAKQRMLTLEQQRHSKEWTYYIAAEEMMWNYAPQMPAYIDEDFKVNYLERGDHRIGKTYKKAVYTQYTDETFTVRSEEKQRKAEVGILGPVIRAQIRDVVKVVFKNMASKPYSIYPHGLTIEKSEEGATYPEGGNQTHAVQPGETHHYTWRVVEEDEPLDTDARCLTYVYHSAVDTARDIASGLIGPLLVCKSQSLNVRNVQLKADKEQHAMFTVFDENQSWYLDENIQRSCGDKTVNKANPDFYKSNVMHTINGYVFESGQILGFCNGEIATWHVSSVGAQDYIQSATFYGHTFDLNERTEDILRLYPMTGETIFMSMDNIGVWLLATLNSHGSTKGMRVMFRDVECFRDYEYEYNDYKEPNTDFKVWEPPTLEEINRQDEMERKKKKEEEKKIVVDDYTENYIDELGLRSLKNQKSNADSDVELIDLSFLDEDVVDVSLQDSKTVSGNKSTTPKTDMEIRDIKKETDSIPLTQKDTMSAQQETDKTNIFLFNLMNLNTSKNATLNQNISTSPEDKNILLRSNDTRVLQISENKPTNHSTSTMLFNKTSERVVQTENINEMFSYFVPPQHPTSNSTEEMVVLDLEDHPGPDLKKESEVELSSQQVPFGDSINATDLPVTADSSIVTVIVDLRILDFRSIREEAVSEEMHSKTKKVETEVKGIMNMAETNDSLNTVTENGIKTFSFGNETPQANSIHDVSKSKNYKENTTETLTSHNDTYDIFQNDTPKWVSPAPDSIPLNENYTVSTQQETDKTNMFLDILMNLSKCKNATLKQNISTTPEDKNISLRSNDTSVLEISENKTLNHSSSTNLLNKTSECVSRKENINEVFSYVVPPQHPTSNSTEEIVVLDLEDHQESDLKKESEIELNGQLVPFGDNVNSTVLPVMESSQNTTETSHNKSLTTLLDQLHSSSSEEFSVNQTSIWASPASASNQLQETSSEDLSESTGSDEVLIYLKNHSSNAIRTNRLDPQGYNWTYDGTHQTVHLEIPRENFKYLGYDSPLPEAQSTSTPTKKPKTKKVNLRQLPQKGKAMKTKKKKELKPQPRSGKPVVPLAFNPVMSPRGMRPGGHQIQPVSSQEDLINMPVVIGVPRPDFSDYELYVPRDNLYNLGEDLADIKQEEYEYVSYKDPYGSAEDMQSFTLDEVTEYHLKNVGHNVKTYFICAEEVEWDYAGYGQRRAEKSLQTRRETKFTKVVFREYLDSSFSTPKLRGEMEEHLGILGPLIQAEVGQSIMVVFRNRASRPYSLHPNGVSYTKRTEGLSYEDESKHWYKYDNEVQPNTTFTYLWEVPERVGPLPGESYCRTWSYYSGVNPEKDIHSGLIGPLLVCRKDSLSTRLVDMREFVLLFMTFDETQSWYFERNSERMGRRKGRAGARALNPTIKENLQFHSINGIVYSLKGLRMYTKQLVRWHLINMGSPKDVHAVHFHGQTFTHMDTNSYRQAVYPLLPGGFATLEMLPSKPGLWQLDTEIGAIQQKGMQTLFLVIDNECFNPLGLESGSVKDSQITAKDVRGYWEPHLARLNNAGKYNAWSTDKDNSWIQVDFMRPVVISQVATQGAKQMFHSQYVVNYTISYSIDRRKWIFFQGDSPSFRQSFRGNDDAFGVEKRTLFPPLIGRFVRFHPIHWYNAATVRLEMYGCELDGCSVPLGMEDGLIQDHQITASSTASSWFGVAWQPSFARLNLQGTVNAWQAMQEDMNQWLQIELTQVKKITGIITQGAKSMGKEMYVISYTLEYSDNGLRWTQYTDDEDYMSKRFNGNSDNNGPVKNYIYPPIFSRFIRVIPTSWKSAITMRIELLGCDFE